MVRIHPIEQQCDVPTKVLKSWGIPYYLPPREAGEDEAGISVLVAALKEWLKISTQRSAQRIAHAIKQTFPERRRTHE